MINKSVSIAAIALSTALHLTPTSAAEGTPSFDLSIDPHTAHFETWITVDLISVPPEQAEQVVNLNLFGNPCITNENLKHFTKLESLNLGYHKQNKYGFYVNGHRVENFPITDEGVRHLTTLTHLDLYRNEIITDRGISPLTNLTHLDLTNNEIVTGDGISSFTNLTHLDLLNNRIINESGISSLLNLQTLYLGTNTLLPQSSFLTKLPFLTQLNLRDTKVSEEIILQLTNLSSLNMRNNIHSLRFIGKLPQLSNLKKLTLGEFDYSDGIHMSHHYFMALLKLTTLQELSLNLLSIARDAIPCLTYLSHLSNLRKFNNQEITPNHFNEMAARWEQAYQYVDKNKDDEDWVFKCVFENLPFQYEVNMLTLKRDRSTC